MAKKTARKRTPQKRKSTRKPAKKASKKGKRTTKRNNDVELTAKQKTAALRKLAKLGQRPSHPTKHLGPVLLLEMGPPEQPKKRKTASKAKPRKKASRTRRK